MRKSPRAIENIASANDAPNVATVDCSIFLVDPANYQAVSYASYSYFPANFLYRLVSYHPACIIPFLVRLLLSTIHFSISVDTCVKAKPQ